MKNSRLCYFNPDLIATDERTLDTDICIYGGNAAGVIAAVQAHRLGFKTIVLEPSGHLGGLTTGGLSYTDFGTKAAIGGLSHEFYRRLGAHYGVAEEWKFEPHVAEKVLQAMIEESDTPVYFRQFLHDVEQENGRLVAITLLGGLKVRASVFLDCTYEGDLMARAGVSYHVGRESNSDFGETFNGVQVRETHQFQRPVSPFVVADDPSSGLLPGIEPHGPGEIGEGDFRVQAYNFRLCLTRDDANKIAYEKPENYDPREYVLLARYLATGWDEMRRKYDPIRGGKVDMNNHGAVSTDFIGRNYEYPGGDYLTRERIFQAHITYQKGLMWFRANDPAVPTPIRDWQAQWGLAADEFPETDGWPRQLYIREARRMIADYVVTDNDCRGLRACDDPVGLASYSMDSHNCRRFVNDAGHVKNEGDVQIGVKPYGVSFRSIVPRRDECANLVVPVCVSSSHIAFGSVRMEPVFMLLGQSAATVAALALDGKVAVQDVPYETLRAQLEKDGQVLAWPAA